MRLNHARLWTLIAVLAALLTAASCAMAADAQDITQECTFTTSYTHKRPALMTDGQYTTNWSSEAVKQAYVIVDTPAGLPCYGVYICFAKLPTQWEVQTIVGGKWTSVGSTDDDYYHVYLPLYGVTQFRIAVTDEKVLQELAINELYMFGNGSVPS